MNATPLLSSLLAALAEARLEVVLIGNAAAALHGAPVTTIDFDFMFRDTPTNLRKLKTVAHRLAAVVLRPYYPVSKFYRMVNDDTGLQADFMPVIHGVRSFEGLKRRATMSVVGGQSVLVAALDDIIKSKKAAGRERDQAVIPDPGADAPGNPQPLTRHIAVPVRHPQDRPMPRRQPKPNGRSQRHKKHRSAAAVADASPSRRKQLAALAAESDRQLEELIARRLALPVEKRMNFLRRRLAGGGSCL